MRLASVLMLSLLSAGAWSLPRESRVPGGIALVPLSADLPADARITLEGHPVWVAPHARQGRVAVVGIPLTVPAGPLALAIESAGLRQSLVIDISAKDYPEQRITLPTQEHVTPSEQNLARYAQEASEQQAVYRRFTPAPGHWLAFIIPTGGPYSSPFGLRRFFNDEPRAPHAGLDIAAPLGQKVIAPAAGVVAQTGDYFFNGRTVMIDHGNGLVSMLCHLDRIGVRIGQQLQQGDTIGTVGKTGRATGPHLHWTVSLNNARIDPLLLLPATP